MKRSIISIQQMVQVFSILFFLWGCAPLQPRVVQLPAQKSPQSVKVLKSDFEGKEISQAEVMLGLKAIFTQTGDRGEQITWTSDRGPSGEFSQNVRGVKIDASMNKMIVTYYNGSKFTSYTYRRPSVDYTTTDIIAELPVNVADDGTNYIITIAYPGTLTVAPQRNMGFEQQPYADTGHVAQDLGAKIEAAKGLSITRNIQIEGKVDSRYGADATYANFVRLLGGGVRKIDTSTLEKKNSFAMSFNGKQLTLDVSVVPYREGAKVIYSCIVPYTVTSSMSI